MQKNKNNNQENIPKHLLIDINSDQQEQISDFNQQVTPTVFTQQHLNKKINSSKSGIVQINSIDALKNNISNKSNYQQENLSQLTSKKSMREPLKIKQTSLARKQSNDMPQIILFKQEQSNQKSIDSMNGSVINFLGDKHNENVSQMELDDQFSKEIGQQYYQKYDSPTKLKAFDRIKTQRITHKTSIFCPDKMIKQQCYFNLDQVYNQINQIEDNNKIISKVIQFLHTPLPQAKNFSMRYVFQIIFFKYTFNFHSMYEFYLTNQNGQLIQILKSEKDSLSVSSSHLLYATNPHDPKQKKFTAKLKYNTVKSEYNLYNIDEKQKPNEQRNILATGFYQKSIGQDRDIKLYIPKQEFINHKFVKSSQNKNIVSYYEQTADSSIRKIQKLSTIPIPKQDQLQAREQFHLKNQGRRIMLANEQGKQAFYMGKKQNQRYLILASAGMTPLHVFMLAVLNLDH